MPAARGLVGEDAEAGDAAVAHAGAGDGGGGTGRGSGRGPQDGLAGDAAAQGDAGFQRDGLAVLAAQHLDGIARHCLVHGRTDGLERGALAHGEHLGGGHANGRRRGAGAPGQADGQNRSKRGQDAVDEEGGTGGKKAAACARRGGLGHAGGELLAGHDDDGNVVLAARHVGGLDQVADGLRGIRRAAPDDAQDLTRGHLVAEAVAREEEGAVGLEGDAADLDEAGVVGRVLLRADVAVDLVAARVLHGVGLAQLARVLALAHRRVIVGNFADGAGAELVQARIADVADGGAALLHQRGGEHARHALIFRVGAGHLEDFVVGDGDGLADALFGGAGLALEAAADAGLGDGGGAFAGGLPANAVHHQEDAALGVAVDAVFVVLPHQPGMRAGGADQFRANHLA